MTQLVKGSRLFPKMPSLLSGFFDDEDFFDMDLSRTGNGLASRLPAANVKENENEFTIDLAVPGMKKDDFRIEIENGALSISSEKKEESEDKTDDYTRKEFSYSSFSRSFRLPDSVKEDKIKAKYDNGVLIVSLPKKEEAKKLLAKKEIKVD
ncbi:MAG: Hsp20/alpha crystallin family protein [Roseivirga sp.]|nr:Hsp20/alpha crystallin family protein [Roseivirga sp.]